MRSHDKHVLGEPSLRRAFLDGQSHGQLLEADGVSCELGQGDVNCPVIVAEIEKLGYNGWATVEQHALTDDIDAPKQIAAHNREYLRSLGPERHPKRLVKRWSDKHGQETVKRKHSFCYVVSICLFR